MSKGAETRLVDMIEIASVVLVSALMDHQFRVTMAVVLWLPIVVLMLLQYTEVIEPGTLGTISLFIPRAFKLPLLGILVGFGLLALLTASRREAR